MINESLLWKKAIDPMSGRIVKEETFLNSAITSLIFLAGMALIGYLAIHYSLI